MEISETVKKLDSEVQVMKTEIQAILLDIRETYLNRENPFNPEVATPIISSPAAKPLVDKNVTPKKESEDKSENKEDDTLPEMAEEDPSLKTESEEEQNEPEEESIDSQEETAQEGVNEGAWGPENIPVSADMSSNGHNGHNGSNDKIDLSIIAVMSQWVNEAVRTVGYDKTESILDVAEIVGHMKPELKAILIKFAKRVPVQEITLSPSTRDFINLLVKLEGLLGMNSKSDEIGLLSIFSQEI
jgi:archaellum component FlaD/FlaE